VQVNVAVLQFSPQERSTRGNLETIVEWLSALENTLVVLPELFLGSCHSIQPLRSQELISTLDGLLSLSRRNSLAIVGSLPVLEEDRLYNRAIAILNGDLRTVYDKKRPFKEERETFCVGISQPAYFTFSGIKVSCQICLDVIDPLTTNMLMRQGVELLCVPAGLSVDLLPRVIQARSLENQIVALLSNRCGMDGDSVEYRGESTVYLPDGQSCSLDNLTQGVKTMSIEPVQLESMRETRRVLQIVQDFGV